MYRIRADKGDIGLKRHVKFMISMMKIAGEDVNKILDYMAILDDLGCSMGKSKSTIEQLTDLLTT